MMNIKALSMVTLTAAFLFGCSSGTTGGTAGTGGTGNSGTGGSGNNGGSTAAGGGGGTTAVTGNVCPSGVTGLADCWVSTTDIPGIKGVYAFGDGVTTMHVSEPTPGTLCLEGVLAQNCCADTASCPVQCANGAADYSLWGGGMGLQLSTGTAAPHTPFNATTAGVTGEKFTLATPPSQGIRAQVSLVTHSDKAFCYSQGGTSPDTAITAAGDYSGQWATDFTQPSWGDPTITWDPTQVDSIQFQAVTGTAGSEAFKFCISNLNFIDAAGTVVNVPPQVDTSAGGGGGAGGAH